MKSGFSLIELVIVLLIVAIVAIVAIPIMRKPGHVPPKEFVGKLNVLMQAAWQQALLDNRVQRILFDFTRKRITISELAERGKNKDADKFVPITQAYLDTELAIPSGYTFNNFYIEKKDQMHMYSGGSETAYFFLTPGGLTQDVILNITDRVEQEAFVDRFGLVLNPFSAQFEYYGTFQSP